MAKNVFNESDIDQTASRLKAVAHPLRLAMVCLLAHGERTVTDICNELGTTQPNISQHLSLLHGQGLLKSRNEENRRFY